MSMLQRFYDAVMGGRERKRARLEGLLSEAMLHTNGGLFDYEGEWSLDSIIIAILEITDELDGKFDGEL